jgi:hypothetical protein
MILVVGTHGGGGSRPSADETRQALRWLGAPPTLLALALLALNDHVLKQAAPGVVTGKLSDVAGLVLAPALLAVGLALLRVPRPPQVSLVATAVGFTLAKTTEWGVDAANAAWSVVWPTHILRDPTDLVALPALLLAAAVARGERRRHPGPRRRVALALGSLALPFAVVATAATGACYVPHGVISAALVRGDFTGAPTGEEQRIVVDVDGESLSLDVGGALRSLPHQDSIRLQDRGRQVTTTCSTSRPQQCWRQQEGAEEPLIEASSDGGRTWVLEHAVPGAELDEALEATHDNCENEDPTGSVADLAVLDTPRGQLVAAAARNAGLLVRNPRGEWVRYPAESLERMVGPAAETSPPTPLPDLTQLDPTPTPPSRVRPTPPGPPPSTPCATPTVVTVTPHPSNGTPFPRETCLTSPYS